MTPHTANDDSEYPHISVSVWNREQYNAALRAGVQEIIINIDRIDKDLISSYLTNKKAVIGLPYVCRADTYDRLKTVLEEIKNDHGSFKCLARNYEEISLLEELGLEYRKDHIPYSMNRPASEVFGNSSVNTISTELSINEIMASGSDEMIVYGNMPVMITAQCVYKNISGGCLKNPDKGSGAGMNGRCLKKTDKGSGTEMNGSGRRADIIFEGRHFKTRQLCDICTNIIYNCDCLDLTDRIDRIFNRGIHYVRFDFSFEAGAEVEKVLNMMKQKRESNDQVLKDSKKTGSIRKENNTAITRGHFNRPVL